MIQGRWSLVWIVSCALVLTAVEADAQLVTLPTGTVLEVVLETHLNTQDSKMGDQFSSRLVMPVFVNEEMVLPMDCIVEGTVVRVQGPGRVSGKAEIQLRPELIKLPTGEELPLSAAVTGGKAGANTEITGDEGTIQASGKEGMNTRGAASTATTGAVLGGMMGGGEGALIGAGAVGAIYLFRQIFKRGNNADLPPGSEITLELNRPLSYNPTMQEIVQPHRFDQPADLALPREDQRPKFGR
jgi:hypothetical protein